MKAQREKRLQAALARSNGIITVPAIDGLATGSLEIHEKNGVKMVSTPNNQKSKDDSSMNKSSRGSIINLTGDDEEEEEEEIVFLSSKLESDSKLIVPVTVVVAVTVVAVVVVVVVVVVAVVVIAVIKNLVMILPTDIASAKEAISTHYHLWMTIIRAATDPLIITAAVVIISQSHFPKSHTTITTAVTVALQVLNVLLLNLKMVVIRSRSHVRSAMLWFHSMSMEPIWLSMRGQVEVEGSTTDPPIAITITMATTVLVTSAVIGVVAAAVAVP
jgi:hypothetical protein